MSCILMRKLVTILLLKMKKKEKKVFASAVSVVFRKMALAFVPTTVSHARPPYHTPVL